MADALDGYECPVCGQRWLCGSDVYRVTPIIVGSNAYCVQCYEAEIGDDDPVDPYVRWMVETMVLDPNRLPLEDRQTLISAYVSVSGDDPLDLQTQRRVMELFETYYEEGM